MAYTTKPDPAKEGADKIHDTLKGVPRARRGEIEPIGQIYKKAGEPWQSVGSGTLGERVADVLGGIPDENQTDAVKNYNGRSERTHDIDRRPMDGGDSITVERRKPTAFTP